MGERESERERGHCREARSPGFPLSKGGHFRIFQSALVSAYITPHRSHPQASSLSLHRLSREDQPALFHLGSSEPLLIMINSASQSASLSVVNILNMIAFPRDPIMRMVSVCMHEEKDKRREGELMF